MTASLEGCPTKAKEAPSPLDVRLAPLDTNPTFQCLEEKTDRLPRQGDQLMYFEKSSN